jgi:hypothetical protein
VIKLNEERYDKAKSSGKPQEEICTYASVLSRIYNKASDADNIRKWNEIADVQCAGDEVLSAVIKKTDAHYSKAKSAGKNQMEVCISAGMLARLYKKAGNTEYAMKWDKITDEECANVDA